MGIGNWELAQARNSQCEKEQFDGDKPSMGDNAEFKYEPGIARVKGHSPRSNSQSIMTLQDSNVLTLTSQ